MEAAPLDGGWEYRLFGAPTPAFHRVEAQRARVEAAERVRTLYVAMTRARQRLVLVGRWERVPPTRAVEAARHHLDLLGHRPGTPDLVAGWDAAGAPGGDPCLDATGALWRFPARRPAGAAGTTAERDDPPPLPSAEEVERVAAELAARRAAASERARRPVSVAASDDAHRLLRAGIAELEDGDGAPAREGAERRDEALASGAAVHRALELLDLAADPAAEVARQRAALPAYVAAVTAADAPAAAAALARAGETWDHFARGPLLERLRALDGRILARELPVLLPPPAAPGGEVDPGAPALPVGFVAGTLDLLYRDPDGDALVVADYKTDRIEGDDDLAVRLRAYAGQGEVYVRALREGLEVAGGAPPEIRFEIWALHLDRVIPLLPPPPDPPATTGPASPASPASPGAPAGPAVEAPSQLGLFPERERTIAPRRPRRR